MKVFYILLIIGLFFIESRGQNQPLFGIKLLIPDTIYTSNYPDSFGVEIYKIIDKPLAISSPEYVINLEIYLIQESDTNKFYFINSPGYFRFIFLQVENQEIVLYKASHVISYLKVGEYTLYPIFFGFIKLDDFEIVSTYEDAIMGKYCLCEPKKIVVIE